jgi:hypothetical protein
VAAVDRPTLVTQMAKIFAGEPLLDPEDPDDELKQRADEALNRVEIFLGIGVEEAKEILAKVNEDFS